MDHESAGGSMVHFLTFCEPKENDHQSSVVDTSEGFECVLVTMLHNLIDDAR